MRLPLEKIIFDKAASLSLIALFSPVFIAIFLMMVLENIFIPSSRGKIIYREKRISAGEPFEILKFRLFKQKALDKILETEKLIDTKKLEGNKINLTYAGRIIKPFYFDELPQLFNILKGDMSLVGPRPVAPANSERLISKGLYSKKLIKAGLTGYFQAQKDKIPPPNQEESDMAYIDFCRDNSGWRIVMEDIKIILSTVLTVLRAKGVYRHHI